MVKELFFVCFLLFICFVFLRSCVLVLKRSDVAHSNRTRKHCILNQRTDANREHRCSPCFCDSQYLLNKLQPRQLQKIPKINDIYLKRCNFILFLFGVLWRLLSASEVLTQDSPKRNNSQQEQMQSHENTHRVRKHIDSPSDRYKHYKGNLGAILEERIGIESTDASQDERVISIITWSSQLLKVSTMKSY